MFSSRKNKDREIDKIGLGEVWRDAQHLRSLVTLAEDQGLVPTTHMLVHIYL